VLSSEARDRVGAGLCMAVGAAAIVLARGYGIGTPRDMGAGFVPVAIGALLLVVGLCIFLTAKPREGAPSSPTGHHGHAKGGPDLRGFACVLGGLVSFMLLGTWGGLVPASFVSVFIAAMGDRDSTVRGAAILAAALTLVAVVVFFYLLSLQMPLFRWG